MTRVPDSSRYVILRRRLGKASAPEKVVEFRSGPTDAAARVSELRRMRDGYWYWWDWRRDDDAR